MHHLPFQTDNASNICDVQNYTGELRQIIDNGYQLATYIYNNPHFVITPKDPIYWLGNDTQKEDPADIAVGRYGFSLKEESFILENMGLYKLLNCYTGSRYTRRHIFKDYAPYEYAQWFSVTWNEMLNIVNSAGGQWQYSNPRKPKGALITLSDDSVVLDYLERGRSVARSILPLNCSLATYENNTTAKTREEDKLIIVWESLYPCTFSYSQSSLFQPSIQLLCMSSTILSA